MGKLQKSYNTIEQTTGRGLQMKIIRSYAKPENAINTQNIVQQLLELELEKWSILER